MKNQEKSILSRPPIVVVLGHVDHGKTTLLDAIRESNVVSREEGGITQSIGASTVTTKDNYNITFVDTPGHSVFNEMRSLGAKIADVAILVVAADDGVKPQTREAISYIKDSEVPYIVAFTKIDLPTANLENAKASLANESVLLNGRGGDVPFVPVSGKTKQGLDDLLEMISIIAQVNGTEADPNGALDAVVIETNKAKQGPLVSAIVRNGTLKIGDNIATNTVTCKVKGILDTFSKPQKEAFPGDPVQILGFSELPQVGATIAHGEFPIEISKKKENKIPQVEENQIAVLVKAGSAGSLAAINSHIPQNIVVIASGVGDVTESDVFLAKSVSALIFTFEVKLPSGVKKLASTEDVDIEEFGVIYKLFERLEELLEKGRIEILGKATVLAEFPFNKQRVAGAKVTEGQISKKDKLILLRKDVEVGKTRVGSLKKEKKDVDLVKAGEEFGLILSPYLDFNVGDVIVSVRK